MDHVTETRALLHRILQLVTALAVKQTGQLPLMSPVDKEGLPVHFDAGLDQVKWVEVDEATIRALWPLPEPSEETTMICDPVHDYPVPVDAETPSANSSQVDRVSAQVILRGRAAELRRQADEYESLAKCLGEETGTPAEIALWNLLTDQHDRFHT